MYILFRGEADIEISFFFFNPIFSPVRKLAYLATNVSQRLRGSRSKEETESRKQRVRMNSHLIPTHFPTYDSYTQCSPSEVVVYHFRYLTAARLSDGLPFVSSPRNSDVSAYNTYVHVCVQPCVIHTSFFQAKKCSARGTSSIRDRKGD